MAKRKSVKNSEPEVNIINKEKSIKKPKRTETIYTITGKQDYLEKNKYPCVKMESKKAQESMDAYAMKISGGTRTKYYAIRGKHGRLYNPMGMFSEGRARKRLGHAGRLEWKFVEIGEKAFRFYRDFLRTKNIAYLLNAERELL